MSDHHVFCPIVVANASAEACICHELRVVYFDREAEDFMAVHDEAVRADEREKAAQRIIDNCIREHNVAANEGEYDGHSYAPDAICGECEFAVAAARGDGAE